MKIKAVIPNSGMDRETLKARESMLSRALSPGTEISVDCIPSGPASIESNTDEVLAGPLLIEAAVRAQREGFDAFVVYCFSDLAVDAIRENVSIPVIGPGETALAAADILSNRFAVITTTAGNISRTRRRLMKNRTAQQKMCAVLSLDIPVTDLRENRDQTLACLDAACRTAVEQYGADTVVLGCLGLAQYGEEMERKYDIKVIDPAFLALAAAELAARLAITPSRRSYAEYGRKA